MTSVTTTKAKPNFDQMLEYWLGDYRPKEPVPDRCGLPYLWKWEDLRSVIYPTRENVDINQAERRGFALVNPSLGGLPYMTNTLYSDLQLLRPGERCTAHRHTTSASRWCMEGEGGYTVIDGERLEFGPGDLVVTPNWSWHHHGNETKKDIIYLNILDIPIVTTLGAVFNDLEYKKMGDKEANYQSVRDPVNMSAELYGGGGIVPTFMNSSPNRDRFTSQFLYPWKNTERQLDLIRKYPGSLYDGIVVEFVNPRTGGPVIPTMSFNMQLLRPDEHTKSHRQTSSAVYAVRDGRGYTQAGTKRIEWKKNDVFAIPPWVWHEHVNLDSKADATLLMVTDKPMVKMLGLYREEGRDENGQSKVIEQSYDVWRI